jgi:hypothetical protein
VPRPGRPLRAAGGPPPPRPPPCRGGGPEDRAGDGLDRRRRARAAPWRCCCVAPPPSSAAAASCPRGPGAGGRSGGRASRPLSLRKKNRLEEPRPASDQLPSRSSRSRLLTPQRQSPWSARRRGPSRRSRSSLLPTHLEPWPRATTGCRPETSRSLLLLLLLRPPDGRHGPGNRRGATARRNGSCDPCCCNLQGYLNPELTLSACSAPS